jgi:heterodisulfide reductase subunit D
MKPSMTSERFTAVQLMELDACTRCNECLNWCPVYEEINTGQFTPAEMPEGHTVTEQEALAYSPRNRIMALKDFINKGYGWRARLFGPKHIPEEDILKFKDQLYHCTTCGACGSVCEAGIDTVEIWESARANMVINERGPYGKQSGFMDLLKSYNVFAADQKDRLCWIPEDIHVEDTAEVGYFTGCTAAYRMQKVGVATVRVLNALGIPFTMLGEEEWCCASVAVRTGQLGIAKEFVNHNVHAAEKKGIKKMVYACAGCHRTSIIDWPKFYEGGELPFKVYALSEYLCELMDEGKLKPEDFKFKHSLDKVVTFHDSCHTGRHVGIYEQPRRILELIPGIKLVEMERNRSYQRCCGAGGGIKAGVSDLALKLAQERVRDGEEVGAEIMTCTCPFCRRNIMDGINSMDTNVFFEDEMVLLAEAMGLDLTVPQNPYTDKNM